jgi:hypothetical protein
MIFIAYAVWRQKLSLYLSREVWNLYHFEDIFKNVAESIGTTELPLTLFLHLFLFQDN